LRRRRSSRGRVARLAYQNLFWFHGPSGPGVHHVLPVFGRVFAEVIVDVLCTAGLPLPSSLCSSLIAVGRALDVVWWPPPVSDSADTQSLLFLAGSDTDRPSPVASSTSIWLGTMWAAAVTYARSVCFSIFLPPLAQFLVGGLTGRLAGVAAVDYHVHELLTSSSRIFTTRCSRFPVSPCADGLLPLVPQSRAPALRLLGNCLLVPSSSLHQSDVSFLCSCLGYDLHGAPCIADYPASAGFTGLERVRTAGSFLVSSGIPALPRTRQSSAPLRHGFVSPVITPLWLPYPSACSIRSSPRHHARVP